MIPRDAPLMIWNDVVDLGAAACFPRVCISVPAGSDRSWESGPTTRASSLPGFRRYSRLTTSTSSSEAWLTMIPGLGAYMDDGGFGDRRRRLLLQDAGQPAADRPDGHRGCLHARCAVRLRDHGVAGRGRAACRLRTRSPTTRLRARAFHPARFEDPAYQRRACLARFEIRAALIPFFQVRVLVSKFGCRGRESNPHDPCGSQDFKSCASASFATPAQ